MPYIPEADRFRVLIAGATTPGELNFLLTNEVLRYLGKKPNYAKFNEVMGVLACIQAELYRRKIAPYEDQKAKENGDIF